MVVLRLVLPLLLAGLCSYHVLADRDEGDLYFDIYTELNKGSYCTRLLNNAGTIGCSTPGRIYGTLRAADTQAALDALVQSHGDNERLALLLHPSLFTSANMDTIKASLDVAGVLLYPIADKPAAGFSPADPSPQANMLPSDKFAWNPLGNGLSSRTFPFAIVYLTAEEYTTAAARAAKNEERKKDGKFANHAADFNFPMTGVTNSIVCLKDGQCLPIGGYSVWATLDRFQFNDTRPIVALTSQLDATSFFHQNVVGADSALAGTVALLAAGRALSQVGTSTLPKQILLAAFTGEAFGYVGSRKFIEETTSFSCAAAASDGSCSRPYRPSMQFQNLKFSYVESVLELNQISANSTLFLHKQVPANAGTTQLINTIKSTAASVPITVADASPAVPGIPPSSLSSFIAARPSMPGVVLTDFYETFANKYYMSMYDDFYNVDAATITKVATLAAKVMYQTAGGTDPTVLASIAATLSDVQTLLNCLTVDTKCALSTALGIVQDKEAPSTPSTYASVYVVRERSTITGTSRFVYEYLKQRVVVNGTAQYHDAVDPGLTFDYDAKTWTVNNASAPLWTESNWPANLGTRVFQRENPSTLAMMMSLGTLMTAFSVLIVHFIKKYCNTHFKNV